MVVIKYDNPDVTTTTTTLSTDSTYGAIIISVADGSSFSTNDFILIESQGSEGNEIAKILTVVSNVITVTAGLELSHKEGITITKLDYDQFIISESTDNAAWTELTTGDLEYQDSANKIRYEYTDWAYANYYKIEYYNSHDSTTTLATIQHNEDDFGYITISDLRNECNITTSITDATLIEGILKGVAWIKDVIYNTKTLETNQQDTTYILDTEGMLLADWNCDGVIDKEDFTIYEVDVDDKRTYLLHKVAKVFSRSARIEFKENVPSVRKTLVIQSPVTFRPLKDILSTLRQVNKLLAVNYILSNVPTERLVKGEFSWTAGGTTVTYDPNLIQEAIIKNEEFIKTIANGILKTYIRKSKLRTTYSQFRQGSVGTVKSPYGMVYGRR